MHSDNGYGFPTNGSSALQPAANHPHLRLIEGGLSSVDSSRPRTRRQEHHVRLTAILLVSAAIFAALVAVSLLGNAMATQARERALSSVPTQTVRVEPGDSLWGIAEEHGVAGVSTSDVARWIASQNSVEASQLKAGQSIVVPVAP